MTTPKQQDWIRVGLVIAQVLVLPILIWVGGNLVALNQRVAVIEANVARLTDLHEDFNLHARDNGIHQTPDVKRAVTFEMVSKMIAKLEDKIDNMNATLPPEWFRDYVEDIKRRVEILEKKNE